MAEAVRTAIYKMGLDNQQYLAAAQAQAQANESLAGSTARVTVSEEKLSVANRTTADSFSRLEARYDKVISLEQRRQAALAQATRHLEEGRVSQERYGAQLDRVNRHYDAQAQRARAASVANDNFNRSAHAGAAAMGTFGGAVDRVRGILGTLGIALSVNLAVREILQAADAWTKYGNQLRAVTGDATLAADLQERLFAIAQRSRSEIGGVITLYQRLATASKELGIDQEELLTFTERVNKSLSLAGVGAQQAGGALLQLGQALGGSVIQAQEFNSLLDGTPSLVQAAANGIERFGGSVGKLRAAVKEGQVSSREFFDGMQAGLAGIDDAFASSESTISQALTRVENAFVRMIGKTDDATGATSGLAGAINDLADALSFVGDNLGFLPGLVDSVRISFQTMLLPLLAVIAAARELGLLKTAAEAQAASEASTAERGAGAFLREGLSADFDRFLTPAPTVDAKTRAELDKEIRGQYDAANLRLAEGRDKITMQVFDRATMDRLRAMGDAGDLAGVTQYTNQLKALVDVLVSVEEEEKRRADALKGSTEAQRDGERAAKEAAKALAERQDSLFEAIQSEVEAGDAIDAMVAALRDERARLGESDEARYVRIKVLEAEKAAIGGGLGDMDRRLEQIATEATLTFRAIEAAEKKAAADRKAIEEQKRLTEERAELLRAPFEEALGDIQDVFSDAFDQILDGGIDSFDDLADTVWSIFKKLAAEIASLLIFEPIVGSLFGGLGLFGGGGGGVPGASLAGGGIGGFLSGATSLSDMFFGGGSAGGMFGGALSGLGDIFGGSFSNGIFGSGGGPLRFVGGAGSANAGAAGANFAGGGMSLGSLLGDSALFGLGGFGMTLASGGSLGEAALTGGGAALGNLALPGIGGILGGLLGSVLGSLFGGGGAKPKADIGLINQGGFLTVGGDLDFGSGSGSGALGGAVMDAGQAMAASINGMLGSLGVKLGPGIFAEARLKQSSLGDRYGYSVTGPGGKIVQDNVAGNNDGSIETAIRLATYQTLRSAAILDQLEGASPVLKSILIKSGGGTAPIVNAAAEAGATEFERLLSIGQQVFDELTPQPVSAFAAALVDLNSAFDAAKESADSFGKTVAEIEALRTGRLEKLRADFDRFLTGDTVSAAFEDIQASIKALIEDARALSGGDVGRFEGWLDQIGALGRDQLRDAFEQTPRGQIGEFGKSLRFSELSPIGLEQQYREARAQFLETRSGALAGESGALGRFQGDASLFLQLSRAFQSSGANYAPDFDLVAGASEQIASTGEQALAVQQQMLEALLQIARNTGPTPATPVTPPVVAPPAPGGPNPPSSAASTPAGGFRQAASGAVMGGGGWEQQWIGGVLRWVQRGG